VPIDLPALYVDLAFLSPLSDRRADRLVRFISEGEPQLVVDVGCGWAELLLRILKAAPDCRGIGIDSDEDAIEHGEAVAAARELDRRATLIAGDVRVHAPQGADALVCIGASQIWGVPPADDGSFTEPLDYRRALNALRDLVPRGGRVVYGEAVWSAEPTPQAIAPLAGRLDEYLTLPELIEVAVTCGFAPAAVHEADLDEWDTFESGYTARYARWLAAHDPADPDCAEVRKRAQQQRAAYLGGYRGVLGMVYCELLAV
jgi:SAM-dependent methyltransferase